MAVPESGLDCSEVMSEKKKNPRQIQVKTSKQVSKDKYSL